MNQVLNGMCVRARCICGNLAHIFYEVFFAPWDRVFMAGETAYTHRLVSRTSPTFRCVTTRANAAIVTEDLEKTRQHSALNEDETP
jgi:hypothetical protein